MLNLFSLTLFSLNPIKSQIRVPDLLLHVFACLTIEFHFSSFFRILVLDYGEVKEFDSPQVLLSRKDGLFYSLAKEAGLVE